MIPTAKAAGRAGGTTMVNTSSDLSTISEVFTQLFERGIYETKKDYTSVLLIVFFDLYAKEEEITYQYVYSWLPDPIVYRLKNEYYGKI